MIETRSALLSRNRKLHRTTVAVLPALVEIDLIDFLDNHPFPKKVIVLLVEAASEERAGIKKVVQASLSKLLGELNAPSDVGSNEFNRDELIVFLSKLSLQLVLGGSAV